MAHVSKPAAIAALAFLAACGSDSTTMVVNRLTSPQQELADLERAQDLGAITPDEYTALRSKVLTGK